VVRHFLTPANGASYYWETDHPRGRSAARRSRRRHRRETGPGSDV